MLVYSRCCCCRESLLQPCACFWWMIIERPNSAPVRNLSLLINNVDAFRPRRIGMVGDVMHVINAEWNREVETLNKIIGDGYALLGSVRLCVTYTLINVRLHLPLIQRMRFANVHGQEIRAILVIIVKSDEVTYLAPERWSRIAAKYQNQRPWADAVAQVKSRTTVER